MPSWKELLNTQRRKAVGRVKSSPAGDPALELRTEPERDCDRILFCTPVRRLADKTQVFPLERNDSVRNRLTHSHEVANLARSIGTILAFNHGIAKDEPNYLRNLPAICAAIGLVHDLGNPPFGHQGEAAIQSWFSTNRKVLPNGFDEQQAQDFLKFEGNAQGFRLVTRLQLLNDDFGLDLTFATLAAMMKYPTGSNDLDETSVAKKKHGYFYSENSIANAVLSSTGLGPGLRHPLAYVMEACDDIAYVVFDAEDAIKKGLASISDLHAWLEHASKETRLGSDEIIESVLVESRQKHTEYRDRNDLSPAELNDVSMQRFRVAAISAMVREATSTFIAREHDFVAGSVKQSLLASSKAETLRKALKDFSFRHAYTHRSVLCVELTGYNVISGLMDMFWAAITDREVADVPSSRRKHPFTRLVYGRISENYRRAFESPTGDATDLPLRYRECQLLTDMVSGMTDSFAMELYKELSELKGEFDTKALLVMDASDAPKESA